MIAGPQGRVIAATMIIVRVKLANVKFDCP
jgi:hypothetical protein